MRKAVLVLLIAVSLVFSAALFSQAAVTINVTDTDLNSLVFQVWEKEDDPGKYYVTIIIGGVAKDDTGANIKDVSTRLLLDDLGPVMRGQIIDILKAAQKKLNQEHINEDVEDLPTID